MKSFIIGFLLSICLALPLFAGSDDIELSLNVVSNEPYRNVELFARSLTGSDLTQIDGINWAIAYNKNENIPSTSLIYDFTVGWTGVIINTNGISLGSYNEEIYLAGVGDDKTIFQAWTPIATIQFEKKGSSWGTVHIVTSLEDGVNGTVITNNSIDQSLLFPSSDQSLPVQMSEIKATASSKEGIILTWTTESEVNNAGFYVWRSEAENKYFTRVSTALISGRGNSSSKNEYSYCDRDVKGDNTYWYKIEAVSTEGKSEFLGPISAMSKKLIPAQFALSQNYPNPFNPVTVAGYDLPEDSNVLIRVFTMLGKEVKVLMNQTRQAGRYTLSWDGTDNQGSLLPSGIYFLQMQAGSFSSVRKMTLIR